METLLHYIWKHRLYQLSPLKTTTGESVEIIDPGLHNTNAGPDFFNAKIKINDRLWAGNVEIHTNSSDWFHHKHDRDKAYNSVILHVIETENQKCISDLSGRTIPQLILKIPDKIKENYEYLLKQETAVPCKDRIREIQEIYLSDWKNALLLERLQRKTQDIETLLNDYSGDWNEVFYVTLARNFGFGINNDAFERLAKSLPLKYILKHKDSALQVEALFFGQTGLLEEDINDPYFISLKKEYIFLKNKYQLRNLEHHLFKSLRIRPNNFPHIKISQLATFSRSIETLFSKMLQVEEIKDIYPSFDVEIPDYWLSHYHFEKQSVKKKKRLGLSAVNLIVINTITPLMIAYGKKKQQNQLVEKGIKLLSSIPPEKNAITYSFKNTGLEIGNAADSQALIQLKNEYCDKKKCIFCRIGHKLLSKM
ncbi:MAG: DUF2851 family protein [Dysgonamonadaceae bacterium]|jgi:hypothetical protein|nr:DUF2851 family protein [Dysgonamonadaceae bacterium]